MEPLWASSLLLLSRQFARVAIHGKARWKMGSRSIVILILFVIYFLLFGEFLKLSYAAEYAKSIDELDALCGFKCLATNFPTVNWQCGSGTNDGNVVIGNDPCLCYTGSPQAICQDPKICQDDKWTGIDTGPDGIKLFSLSPNPTTAVPSIGSKFSALTALKELNLQNFNIKGSLPSLMNTPAMEKLYLNNNLLTGNYIPLYFDFFALFLYNKFRKMKCID